MARLPALKSLFTKLTPAADTALVVAAPVADDIKTIAKAATTFDNRHPVLKTVRDASINIGLQNTVEELQQMLQRQKAKKAKIEEDEAMAQWFNENYGGI